MRATWCAYILTVPRLRRSPSSPSDHKAVCTVTLRWALAQVGVMQGRRPRVLENRSYYSANTLAGNAALPSRLAATVQRRKARAMIRKAANVSRIGTEQYLYVERSASSVLFG